MTKWEYLVTMLPRELPGTKEPQEAHLEVLTQLGKDGWELAGIANLGTQTTTHLYGYLKRPLN